MVVVLADDQQRSQSGKLRASLDEIHQKCLNSEDYCLKGDPFPLPLVPRTATAVVAHLNQNAQDEIARRHLQLPTYEGRIRQSVRTDQLEEVARMERRWQG